jgi:hypothetical protein
MDYSIRITSSAPPHQYKEAKMSINTPVNSPDSGEDFNAELEKSFIDEYLRNNDQTRESLRKLPAENAHQIMSKASTYASSKLAEIDSRAHYAHNIKGDGRNGAS